jgi:hypothetical protein
MYIAFFDEQLRIPDLPVGIENTAHYFQLFASSIATNQILGLA